MKGVCNNAGHCEELVCILHPFRAHTGLATTITVSQCLLWSVYMILTAYFRTLYQVANALASLQGETIEGILRSRENSVDLTYAREYSVDLAQGDVQLPELRRERNVRDAITAQQVLYIAVACCTYCAALCCTVL
jgi:hypothetical protein